MPRPLFSAIVLASAPALLAQACAYPDAAFRPEGGGAEGSGGSAGGGAGTAAGGTGSGAGGGGACPLDHLVISEVCTRRPGLANGEIVELWNPLAEAVRLDAQWVLLGRSSGNPSYTARWTGDDAAEVYIPAGGHFLIVGPDYEQAPEGDATFGGLSDSGSLRLQHGDMDVDVVCFVEGDGELGAGYVCEGEPANNSIHGSGEEEEDRGASVDASLERKPGGAAGHCTDTNDNAADFTVAEPPRPSNSKGD